MNDTELAASQNPHAILDWFSILQLGLSALAILGLWSLAFLLAALGLVEGLQAGFDSSALLSMLLMAGALAACGLLLIPSAGYALARLLGKPVTIKASLVRWLQPARLIFALPVVLLLGYLVSEVKWAAWIVLPVLHILAIGLPILWFLYLGVRDLPSGSPQRSWGVFGSGLVLSPFLIMLAELFALVLFLFVATLYIISQPELLEELASLSEWVMTSNPSTEMLVERIGPYLLNPPVLLAVFAFIAVVVPLIEEAIKPVGVWLLVGRNITPAAGFAAGVLSGAGYALFESLMLTSGGGNWAALVAARTGTAVIHILTSGLMGMALVQAWRFGRYARLGITYLSMVLVHGLWNGFTLFLVTSGMYAEFFPDQKAPALLQSLGTVAPFILAAISLGSLAGLIWMNRTLVKGMVERQRYSLAGERVAER